MRKASIEPCLSGHRRKQKERDSGQGCSDSRRVPSLRCRPGVFAAGADSGGVSSGGCQLAGRTRSAAAWSAGTWGRRESLDSAGLPVADSFGKDETMRSKWRTAMATGESFRARLNWRCWGHSHLRAGLLPAAKLGFVEFLRRRSCLAGSARPAVCPLLATAAAMVMPIAGLARSARKQATARTDGEQCKRCEDSQAQQR